MNRKNLFLLVLILLLLVPRQGFSQSLMSSGESNPDLFDNFEDDQYRNETDQEVMKKKFQEKQRRYQSLLTQKTPVFFKADHQEIIEKERVFILTGNVSIRKDDFKVLADKVVIDQFAGEITARGNVEIHFGDDILTGDEAYYNYDLGKGWIKNVRGHIEPSLFVEGELMEKLTDYEKTNDSQYTLLNGFVTACSGTHPDWKVKSSYALIRVENYAQVNKSSFWIGRVPIFYTPYWFYPTKTDRATGLLLPHIGYSTQRGFIFAEEFFWVLNDYMDVTFGERWFSNVGSMEEFQWRNAFDQYSQGEFNFAHIKERESPSDYRAANERWRSHYEQTYIFPWEVRGTLDMDFRSDQYFAQDYGTGLEQDADRYMESRMSLTKNWDLAHLTVDGDFQRDFNENKDETLQHLPRVEFNSGSQTIFANLKYSMDAKAEWIKRKGQVQTSYAVQSGILRVEDWMERDAFRPELYGQLWYEFKDTAWFSFTPRVGLRETWWNKQKSLDPEHIFGSWATYPSEPPPEDNSFPAGMSQSGNGLRRDIYDYGFTWTGPRFYRIYDILGYDRVSKIKHLIEPKLEFNVTPEVNQERIIEFDANEIIQPGKVLTYSITNRFLAKVRPKRKKKQHADDKRDTDAEASSDQENDDTSDADTSETDTDMQNVTDIAGAMNPNPDGQETEPGENPPGNDRNVPSPEDASGDEAEKDDSYVREFGYFTISQSYDFYKADHWDTREPPNEGEDERQDYALGNIRFEATVNPFDNIYFSSRIEYDPYYDSFSNGYLYGHIEEKRWKFGVRWDYSKNFITPLFDLNALALEGGWDVTDSFGFATWVKYDFEQQYFPYLNLDLTYTSQCWAITLHTYYVKDREGLGTPASPIMETTELKFGISIRFKNLDSVGPRKVGKFFW